MANACSCTPQRKCMRCRKSHDSLQTATRYTYPVEWVVNSSVENQVAIQNHGVRVQNQEISRKAWSQGVEQKTFVGPLNPEILVDRNRRTIWKEFTTGFDPDNLNAIKANHGIASWDGPNVYVGRVTKKNGAQTQIIGTIYREVVNEVGTWKLRYVEGNNPYNLNGSPQQDVLCHVLCDTQPVAAALA